MDSRRMHILAMVISLFLAGGVLIASAVAQGDPYAALRAQSAALSPDQRSQAQMFLAAAYELWKAGDFLSAEVGFKRGLDIDPTNGPANYYYADILQRKGDIAGASEYMSRAAIFGGATKEGLQAQALLTGLREKQVQMVRAYPATYNPTALNSMVRAAAQEAEANEKIADSKAEEAKEYAARARSAAADTHGKNGLGTRYESGFSYEGQWENSAPNGLIVWKQIDYSPSTYAGECTRLTDPNTPSCLLDGYGVLSFPDGREIAGKWVMNRMTVAVRRFPDGTRLEGQFSNGNGMQVYGAKFDNQGHVLEQGLYDSDKLVRSLAP